MSGQPTHHSATHYKPSAAQITDVVVTEDLDGAPSPATITTVDVEGAGTGPMTLHNDNDSPQHLTRRARPQGM